jgi:hypothetical protein
MKNLLKFSLLALILLIVGLPDISAIKQRLGLLPPDPPPAEEPQEPETEPEVERETSTKDKTTVIAESKTGGNQIITNAVWPPEDKHITTGETHTEVVVTTIVEGKEENPGQTEALEQQTSLLQRIRLKLRTK